MWGSIAMLILFGGTVGFCALFVFAGVGRIRSINRQQTTRDRATSAVIGVASIAGAVYVVVWVVRYLLSRPDWL